MYFLSSCKWLHFALNTNGRIYSRSSEAFFEVFKRKVFYILLQSLWDIRLWLTMCWQLYLTAPNDVGWIMNQCMETTQFYALSITFQAGEVMWEISSFFQKSYVDAQPSESFDRICQLWQHTVKGSAELVCLLTVGELVVALMPTRREETFLTHCTDVGPALHLWSQFCVWRCFNS